MQLDITKKSLPVFSALASDTRLKILQLLKANPSNIKDIALELDISQAITTRHVKILVDAGLVNYKSTPAKRGLQKLCYIEQDKIIIDINDSNNFNSASQNNNFYCYDIPVGQYTGYSVMPTCGLASTKKIIGMLDDPRYFADPKHNDASLLWFGSGWVQYTIPNYLLKNQLVTKIEITLEICSEAPGFKNNWPSDISFSINSKDVGMWTSPGDFGGKRGMHSPEWYTLGTQFGQLKTIIITNDATFVDGIKVSDISLNDIDISYGNPITFKIANPIESKNCGGITLFGKGFGNYNQNIIFKTHYVQ